ncbi:thioredoxin [Candidatus Woesebacteria bacterium RIFCSPHIGHO2_12_FULL_42_9]|uniref:Thioredoxin n=3 Tax=Candidatus Woeseibacteriota TaxID=1752722 RepID=A0A1F8ASF1_9BACT|nr:MAG: Thioredoxin [Candidatus Woesebacteria bacterium GW2011_GWB1_43_14]OGM07459.1 MAG: thioredoxin [Candidatus Woesebacteria bacterium GWC1_42_13]OGM54429.1 MAG: thioredoxin [Candidatus Woesebacteria bacterium RIFCSPHIGHO2_12_FULL_42_9]
MTTASVTDAEFDPKVLKSTTPVLVDFWAPWCAPCKMAEPILEELSETYKGKTEFLKLNVDDNSQTPMKYGVMSIPTTILYKEGKEIGRQIGFAGKEAFENLLRKGI